MKLRVTFDFHFDKNLTEDERVRLIELIENWSEYHMGAFLDFPGGLENIFLSHEFIEED